MNGDELSLTHPVRTLLHLELDREVLGFELRFVLLDIGERLFARAGPVCLLASCVRALVLVFCLLAVFDEQTRQLRVALDSRRVGTCEAFLSGLPQSRSRFWTRWLTSLENDSSSQKQKLVRLFAERNLIRAKDTRAVLEKTVGSDHSIEEVTSDLLGRE